MNHTIRMAALAAALLLGLHATAQKSIPDIVIKTMDGQTARVQDYLPGKPVTILSFWATWCKPCQLELDNIAELYEEWQEEYGVQLVAVTIDTRRALAKVPGLVESKGWPYIILSDENEALRQALNFQSIPQTYLLDAEGHILYEHSGYVPGNEYELENYIKKALGRP